MGPAFYVMAILGCGEAEGACEPVSTLATRYESQEACSAATSSAIEKHSDLLYPVVVAQCRPANSPASAQVWADEVKLPASHQAPRIQRASFKPTRARS
jgi:hypothetical protein